MLDVRCRDVSAGEVIPLEKQRLPLGPGQGVSKAIAEVKGGGVAALAIVKEGREYEHSKYSKIYAIYKLPPESLGFHWNLAVSHFRGSVQLFKNIGNR